jgi:hypothetical protein
MACVGEESAMTRLSFSDSAAAPTPSISPISTRPWSGGSELCSASRRSVAVSWSLARRM